MRSPFLLLLAIPGIALPLAGQAATGSIQGRVVQLASGEPVPGAMVRINQPRLGVERTAITDALGYFRMQLLPPETYTLEVNHPGFHGLPRQVSISTDRPAKVVVWMKREEPQKLD